STQIGFLLVAIWMVVFFRLFGLIANFALVFNLAMILTIMSWICDFDFSLGNVNRESFCNASFITSYT
ncbi:hypothetical protein EA729_08635, partial [Acinetobacter baumannii]